MARESYVDIAWRSLNKKNEELCGDKVEVSKQPGRILAVLADGLGSGVKAHILATLTSKMMITLLERGIALEETIDTIMKTLPVCSVRKIAYSTFTVVELDDSLQCRIIEYDNPPIFILRNKELLNPARRTILSGSREIRIAECRLEPGDELVVCSDGVIHAGVGEMLNHGWEWEHVAHYLQRQHAVSADALTRGLVDVCNKLYQGLPGDDTTVLSLKIRDPQYTHLLTGPPQDCDRDEETVNRFVSQHGKKVICGGTAAQIVSRVLGCRIDTQTEYEDPTVPPTACMRGFDLVTEGVLTMERALQKLIRFNDAGREDDLKDRDGATRLLRMLLDESTHIVFWFGQAINPAHQNPDFPAELCIKKNIVERMAAELERYGKVVEVVYTDR